MGAILVILAFALTFALTGFPLTPVLVWAFVVGVMVWIIRFGPRSRTMARVKHVRWYRRW